jgi:hypothetical protein
MEKVQELEVTESDLIREIRPICLDSNPTRPDFFKKSNRSDSNPT